MLDNTMFLMKNRPTILTNDNNLQYIEGSDTFNVAFF